jgi:hypothetical protein
MVYAAVKTCSTFGGKVKHVDAAPVQGRPGVIAVAPIPDAVAGSAGMSTAHLAIDRWRPETSRGRHATFAG